MLALGAIADFRECCEWACARLRRFGGKQRLGIDARRLRQSHRLFDPVAQLAHLAEPGVPEQSLLGCRCEAVDITLKRLRKLRYELVSQRQDVVGAVAKRRNKDRYHVDYKIQVPAEAAPGHLG